MRDLQGLEFSDFETKGNIILGKVEVDKDGSRNFTELEGVTRFDIQSNITNLFLKTCAKTFNIELLNTDDEYSLFDKGKSKYDHIRQGRRCKLYIGIEKDSEYHWSWVYGIIDNVTTSKSADGEMCSISGRDYIAYLSENYLKNLWWGLNKKYTVTPNTEFYQMEDNCKGIYRAFLKIGDNSYREIRLNSEFTYDWDINQFVFLKPNVPDVVGELWVYYFTAQKVEDVIVDLLIESGLLNITQKLTWLSNINYCIPTGVEVDRVYFSSGTNYINAIENLMQVAPYYRLYINNNGIPCFKPPPDLSHDVKTLKESEYMIRNTEDRIDELYNHFIIEGEKREMRRNWISVTAYSEVKDLTSDSVTLQGAVTSKAEDTTVVRRGFIWQAEGQAEESWYETGNFELGYYSHTIIVEPDTNYKFRSVAMDNSWNTKKSPWQYFKTPESEMS